MTPQRLRETMFFGVLAVRRDLFVLLFELWSRQRPIAASRLADLYGARSVKAELGALRKMGFVAQKGCGFVATAAGREAIEFVTTAVST